MEDLPPSELGLVARARGGDRAAFSEIVKEYQDIAFRTAFLITRSAADAEDAAQEGFIKAYRALGRLRPGAPIRPWLLTIVANEARNRGRSARRREALRLRVEAGALVSALARSVEEEVVAQERRGALLSAIDALRDEDRLALGCRYLLELSEDETAAALGWPLGTVKSRTHRALGRLRRVLEEAP